MFLGKIHGRKLLIPVVNRDGSCGVFYKRVIALPLTVSLLMELHFDLYAFMDGLNHRYSLSSLFIIASYMWAVLQGC